MRLSVLGSSGTYPTPGRPSSGYLITHKGCRIWVDSGTGSFAALQELTDFARLDAVVVTHVHADHCVDLFPFYYAVRFGTSGRTGVPVFCPDGVADRLGAMLGVEEDDDFFEVLDFRRVGEADEVEVAGTILSFALTQHPVPTIAVRAEAGGRALVYSSDTGPSRRVVELAQRADLFLCEATYQGGTDEKPWPHHLTAEEAGTMGRQAEVRRLMLTHIWPTLDPARSVAEAEEVFGRPVSLAVSGMEVDV